MILDNDNSDEFLQESLFRRHNLHGLSSSELIPFIWMCLRTICVARARNSYLCLLNNKHHILSIKFGGQ